MKKRSISNRISYPIIFFSALLLYIFSTYIPAAFNKENTTLEYYFLLLLGSTSIGLIAAFFIKNIVIFRLKQFKEVILKRYSGDKTSFLEPTSDDEITEISFLFNQMLEANDLYELQLKNTQERFEDITDSVGEYVWELDFNGNFLYVSNKSQEILGYKPSELKGKNFTFIIPEEDISKAQEEFKKIKEGKGKTS